MRDYEVFRVDRHPEFNDPYKTFVKVNLVVKDGCYFFYGQTYKDPEAIFPIDHFMVFDVT